MDDKLLYTSKCTHLLIIVNKPKDTHREYKVKILKNSIKYYLPRVEGYLEVIKKLASDHSGMSLIEFDGYFEKRFEPVKDYARKFILMKSM